MMTVVKALSQQGMLSFLALQGVIGLVLSFSLGPTSSRETKFNFESSIGSRREVLTTAIVVGASASSGALVLLGVAPSPQPANAVRFQEDSTYVLRLETPNDKAGLALYDVTIGTPPRTVVAIQKIVIDTKKNRRLQPGLVLKDYVNAQSVIDRIRNGPYPIELVFYNLDTSNGELGEALTAQDALTVAQKQSSSASSPQPPATAASTAPETAAISPDNNTYVKRVVKSVPPESCRLVSRRDDVLEINYSAHIGTVDGIIYDDSSFRGTGRPYQMVLGSGDMIPGVDQGLYNMCPGEVRVLEIPPSLAYGAKGNRLFRIPPNSRLVWEVELVSVSTMRELPGEEDDDE